MKIEKKHDFMASKRQKLFHIDKSVLFTADAARVNGQSRSPVQRGTPVSARSAFQTENESDAAIPVTRKLSLTRKSWS